MMTALLFSLSVGEAGGGEEGEAENEEVKQ